MAPEASAEVVTAKKKGEGSLEKDVDPNAGCTCYMSFTGVENLENAQWTLEDVTDPDWEPAFSYGGTASGWSEQSGSGFQPYPSPYFPLAPPDAGCHKFLVGFYFSPPENAKLHTSVRCYDQNGDLATEVFFTFSMDEIDQPAPPIPGGYDWRLTSCTYLYQTPGEPDPHDCSPFAK